MLMAMLPFVTMAGHAATVRTLVEGLAAIVLNLIFAQIATANEAGA